MSASWSSRTRARAVRRRPTRNASRRGRPALSQPAAERPTRRSSSASRALKASPSEGSQGKSSPGIACSSSSPPRSDRASSRERSPPSTSATACARSASDRPRASRGPCALSAAYAATTSSPAASPRSRPPRPSSSIAFTTLSQEDGRPALPRRDTAPRPPRAETKQDAGEANRAAEVAALLQFDASSALANVEDRAVRVHAWGGCLHVVVRLVPLRCRDPLEDPGGRPRAVTTNGENPAAPVRERDLENGYAVRPSPLVDVVDEAHIGLIIGALPADQRRDLIGAAPAGGRAPSASPVHRTGPSSACGRDEVTGSRERDRVTIGSHRRSVTAGI